MWIRVVDDRLDGYGEPYEIDEDPVEHLMRHQRETWPNAEHVPLVNGLRGVYEGIDQADAGQLRRLVAVTGDTKEEVEYAPIN
jgi:hypothetical protein